MTTLSSTKHTFLASYSFWSCSRFCVSLAARAPAWLPSTVWMPVAPRPNSECDMAAVEIEDEQRDLREGVARVKNVCMVGCSVVRRRCRGTREGKRGWLQGRCRCRGRRCVCVLFPRHGITGSNNLLLHLLVVAPRAWGLCACALCAVSSGGREGVNAGMQASLAPRARRPYS